MKEYKIQANFQFADKNQDGKLSKDEFMALRTDIGKDYVDAFVHMDKNKDGKLTFENFSEGYKMHDKYVQDGTIHTAFKFGDLNKDGSLDFDEFKYLWKMKYKQLVIPDGKSIYDHIEYDGYEKFNGYCK